MSAMMLYLLNSVYIITVSHFIGETLLEVEIVI